MNLLLRLLSKKLMGLLPFMALALAVSTANSACFFFAHQPDVPNGLKDVKKFKIPDMGV
jgi:cyclic lactone autoinducer peptide